MKLIHETDPDEIKEIQNIADSAFGKDYFNLHSILEENNNNAFIHVAKSNEITGFIYYTVLYRNELDTITTQSFPLKNALQEEIYGLIKTEAVSPKHQKQGIGMKLFQEAISHLHKINIKVIYTVIWKQSPNIQALEKLLMKNDFHLLLEITDYWKEDSLQKKYDCPVCGNPCHCTALIFRNKL